MNIVVLGGGTGSLSVLTGLKQDRNLNITTIVNMTDDGGSNQIIRDEFGILPLSDLRKSIIALSRDNRNEILRNLFTYRFDKGNGLSGHTLGNLIMTALTQITGSELEAIRATCEIFDVQGTILPITLEHVRLGARYSDGSTIQGEHLIDEPEDNINSGIISYLYSTPIAHATPEAVAAIHQADFIIIGPGDLYTTTIANLIIDGIPEALETTSAKLIYITNIMTKLGQTRHMTAQGHVNEIERYAHRRPDLILVNTGELPENGLKRYQDAGEAIVIDDLPPKDPSVIRADIVANESIYKSSGDTLARSFIRHDPMKLMHTLKLIFKNR